MSTSSFETYGRTGGTLSMLLGCGSEQRQRGAARRNRQRSQRRGRRTILGALAVCIVAGAYFCEALTCAPRASYARAVAVMASDLSTREQLEQLRYELSRLDGRMNYEPQASLLRAKLLIAARKYDAALDKLSIADSDDATRKKALVLAGEALYYSGRFMEAGSAWTRAIELDRDNLDAYRWLGVAYFEIGAVESAVDYLQEVAKRAPTDPRPHRVIGLIFSTVDEYGLAAEAYREALRRGPNHPQANEVRFELARALNDFHENEEALELLAECPLDADVLGLRGTCLYGLGRIDDAAVTLDQALATDPDHFKALTARAKIALERSETELAAQLATRAAELKPNSPDALSIVMATDLRRGNRDEAKRKEQLLQKIHKRYDDYHHLVSNAASRPADADIRYQAGVVAAELDLQEAAIGWFRAAIYLDPEHRQAAAALRSLGATAEPETVELQRLQRSLGSSSAEHEDTDHDDHAEPQADDRIQ